MKIPQNCKPGALLRKGVCVLGAALTNWPAQVRADAALALKWAEFRASNITAVVRAVAARVRAEAPGVEISAAVFRNPATAARRRRCRSCASASRKTTKF